MEKVNRCYGKRNPDIDRCETRAAGAVIPGTTLSVYYCSLEDPDCKFARSFGYDYLCRHSDCHTFALEAEQGLENSP